MNVSRTFHLLQMGGRPFPFDCFFAIDSTPRLQNTATQTSAFQYSASRQHNADQNMPSLGFRPTRSSTLRASASRHHGAARGAAGPKPSHGFTAHQFGPNAIRYSTSRRSISGTSRATSLLGFAAVHDGTLLGFASERATAARFTTRLRAATLHPIPRLGFTTPQNAPH